MRMSESPLEFLVILKTHQGKKKFRPLSNDLGQFAEFAVVLPVNVGDKVSGMDARVCLSNQISSYRLAAAIFQKDGISPVATMIFVLTFQFCLGSAEINQLPDLLASFH